MKQLWQNTYARLGLSFLVLVLLVLTLALPALTVRTLGEEVIFEAEAFASNRNIDGSLVYYNLDIENVSLSDIDADIISRYEAQQASFEGFGPLFRLEDTTLYLHLTLDSQGRVVDTRLALKPPSEGLYLRAASHILNYDYRVSEQTPPLIGIDLDFGLPPFNSSLNFVNETQISFEPQPVLVHARLWRGRIQVTDITRP